MVDVESLVKLSSGIVDVKTFLVSRNTLGNGKTTNSKSQTSNVKMLVAESGGDLHLAMRKWNDGLYTSRS